MERGTHLIQRDRGMSLLLCDSCLHFLQTHSYHQFTNYSLNPAHHTYTVFYFYTQERKKLRCFCHSELTYRAGVGPIFHCRPSEHELLPVSTRRSLHQTAP